VSGAQIAIVPNPGPAQQSSLLIDNEHAFAVARFLRDDPTLRLDFCSNVTGVDWLDRVVKKTVKMKRLVDGEEKEVDETTEEKIPGYLEAVYHLYSMTHKHGPVIIRIRTRDRGHPDLRRILMWDEFVDYPMRKDYREPDDYEWEPTPHDEVLEKAKRHYTQRPELDGAEKITAGGDALNR